MGGWGGVYVLPVAKASHSGTANPCSCKWLAAVSAAWTAGDASFWGVGIDATKSRHVAGLGCGALGEYLPRKPNALGWL